MNENDPKTAEPEQLDAAQNQTEQQTLDAQSGDGARAGRLFTQEEVNSIVKDRLQRDREKRKPEQAAALEARTAELNARESRLDCKAFLLESGYPEKLLDIIDTSDIEKFKSKAAEAAAAFGSRRSGSRSGDRSLYRFCAEETCRDTIGEAFNQNQKHKPKPHGVF